MGENYRTQGAPFPVIAPTIKSSFILHTYKSGLRNFGTTFCKHNMESQSTHASVQTTDVQLQLEIILSTEGSKTQDQRR